jgi:hypothetical protein
MERPSNDKGEGNVEVYESRSCDFTSGIAGGDIRNRPRGLDHYGQELLAKRSEADRSCSDQHRAQPTA